MSWLEFHRQSERLASEAEIASRQQDNQLARHLYLSAAQAEEKALLEVEIEKSRTYGITAVSAVSLYFKASEWQLARSLAHRCLGTEHLPAFAYPQLDDLLDSIKIRQAVVDLDGAYMLVSVRGGEVLPGGAPLDLVVAKNQGVKSWLYRTVEHLKGVPHRFRGEPSKYIKDSYRPWLFQAAPGSYQFSATVQLVRQLSMFDTNDMPVSTIVGEAFEILGACAGSPRTSLQDNVKDEDYQRTFLKLARDLAPSEKERRYSSIEVSSGRFSRPIILVPGTRNAINDVIRESRPSVPDGVDKEIRGILRALHLDDDWIEVFDGSENWKIERVSEEIDDRIGPMVNQPVLVQAVQTGNRTTFVDIETDE